MAPKSATHEASVHEVSPFWLTVKYAQRLCARLGQAAHHVGLTHYANRPDSANDSLMAEHPWKPITSPSPPSHFYERLFGSDFLSATSSHRSESAPDTPKSSLQTPSTPSQCPHSVPRTPPSALSSAGAKRTASEALLEAADAPQLGSAHRSGSHSTDLHNHPTPLQLLREQRNARHESYGSSPKRVRHASTASGESFHTPPSSLRFPVSPARAPRSGMTSFAYGAGMKPRTAATPRRPFSRPGHVRMASMPEAHQDHYVPVRSYDPVPPQAPLPAAMSEMAMMRPWPVPPRGFQALRSHVRGASSDTTVPLSRKHRRSISHGGMDSSAITPRPVSHDRSSRVTTPPTGEPTLPVTPKTMNGNLSYGEFLNISPSPQPRGSLRVRGAPDVLPLSPPGGANALPHRSTDRHAQSMTARGARPLWAQSSQR